MGRVVHGRRHWRRRLVSALGAVLLVTAVAGGPGAASAQVAGQVQQTVLARGQEELAAGAWLFRIGDNILPPGVPPGAPGVTHAHASGFDYAVEGTHVIAVDGTVRFGGQPIPAEGVVVQYPGDTRNFTNTGPGPARLLALAVSTAGAAPAGLPRTGSPLPALWVALAAGAGLVGLGAILGRGRRVSGAR